MSKETLLCTVDPNIPHEDGLETLTIVLDDRKDKSVSTEILLELTECVLKHNVFEHNSQIFKQL